MLLPAALLGVVAALGPVAYWELGLPRLVDFTPILAYAVAWLLAFKGGRRGLPEQLLPAAGAAVGAAYGWRYVAVRDGLAPIPGALGPEPWYPAAVVWALPAVACYRVGVAFREQS